MCLIKSWKAAKLSGRCESVSLTERFWPHRVPVSHFGAFIDAASFSFFIHGGCSTLSGAFSLPAYGMGSGSCRSLLSSYMPPVEEVRSDTDSQSRSVRIPWDKGISTSLLCLPLLLQLHLLCQHASSGDCFFQEVRGSKPNSRLFCVHSPTVSLPLPYHYHHILSNSYSTPT